MRRPDVLATGTEAVLVTVPNVEIMEAGVEYQLSTGPTTFTPSDLRDVVTAANEDNSIPSPRLKIGHIDPRFNGTTPWDGSPAFGKVVNLSLSENGMVVYGDFVGVPKWLADIMASAYPSRSVEIFWNVESQMGKQWRAVCSAVALLGVVWPGVTTLEDLPLYYGAEMPSDVEVVATAASQREEGGMKLFTRGNESETAAAADLDDVRRTFYQDYAEGDKYWWWIRAVMVDPNQLVVENDNDGQLYLLPFSTDAEGNVEFGEASEVRVEYVPDTRKKEAAASIASILTAGRRVEVSFASRAESRPTIATQGGAMDHAKEIRTRLGLGDDASNEEVQAKIAELNALASGEDPAAAAGDEPAEPVVPSEQHVGTGDRANDQPVPPAPAPAEAATPAPAETQPAAAASAADELVQVDRATLESLQSQAAMGADARRAQLQAEDTSILDAALAAGKFPPARREAWANYMTQDRVGARAAIEQMAPGLIPVGTELGSTGEESGTTGPSYPPNLLPEVQARREREAAVASGAMPRPRIVREGA